MRLLILTLFLFLTQCSSSAQSVLDKARGLGLGELRGSEVTAYYSDGFQARADSIRILLADSVDFFEDRLGVEQRYDIVLLNERDWSQLTEIPYGLPFVSGPPFIVCIPATSDHALGEAISKALGHRDLGFGQTEDEVVNSFIELIGFHELGHIYARSYGLDFPNKWTFEFAATYLAFFYLEENYPEKSRLWQEVSGALLEELKPAHTSLEKFEELYVGLGVRNYAWFQIAFLARAVTVYEEVGIDFLQVWRRNGLPADSKTYHIDELNRLHNGFVNWAEKYSLVPILSNFPLQRSQRFQYHAGPITMGFRDGDRF